MCAVGERRRRRREERKEEGVKLCFCTSAFLVESNGVSGVLARFLPKTTRREKDQNQREKKHAWRTLTVVSSFLPSLPPSLTPSRPANGVEPGCFAVLFRSKWRLERGQKKKRRGVKEEGGGGGGSREREVEDGRENINSKLT